jgi:hypothetical protein
MGSHVEHANVSVTHVDEAIHKCDFAKGPVRALNVIM